MIKLELIDADDLDYDAFCRLQKDSYSEVLVKTNTSDSYMTPGHFQWKYHPPAGNAKIAAALDGGQMLAANGMMPFSVRVGNDVVRGWQSCDTATLPRARRSGFFFSCLKTLESALAEDEVFFGFPNKNSVRGFQKLGWTQMGVVTAWIDPLVSLNAKTSYHVFEIERFGERHDSFIARSATRGKVRIERSAEYLNWRYTKCPQNNYTLFEYMRDDKELGFSVARTATVMNRHVAIVMELWGEDGLIERTMLKHMAGWACKRGISTMVSLDSGLSLKTAIKSGFLPTPSRLLPKKQVLMGYATEGVLSREAVANKWRVQMGDWDVF